jgi:hypothetical protein
MHAAIREALTSPLDSASLGLTVRVEPGLEKGEEIFRIYVDAQRIRFDEEAGHRKGSLEIILCQLDAKSNAINPVAGHLLLDYNQSTYDRVMAEGIKLVKHVTIAPQSETVKVLVRDTTSGAMGTLSVPVENDAQPVPHGTTGFPSAPSATKHP